MKVGETWELKKSAPRLLDNADYLERVLIDNITYNFVTFTDIQGEVRLDYYSGMPREMFLKAYSKVYDENR